MLKQVTLTLDTSDPLQAQWLVEYLASADRVRFGRACLLLGFLAATGQVPVSDHAAGRGEAGSAEGKATPTPAVRAAGVGAGLFGLD